MVKLVSNLIQFKCKMGINVVFSLLDLGGMLSFMSQSVMEFLGLSKKWQSPSKCNSHKGIQSQH